MDDLGTAQLPDPVRAPASRRAEPIAALDLGTNNCRLLVARPSADGFTVIDSFSRIVRLGEGLAATGQLGEAAMSRTLTALRICARIIDRHRVARLRCVTTEACRRAGNGAAFIAQVERQCGLRLEVLDHEEEARLAMLGCLPLIEPAARRLMMVDIGGGSTEVMWLDRGVLEARPGRSVSLPLGVVTLSESRGADGGAAGYGEMIARVRHELGDAAGRGGGPGPGYRPQLMLGTSGTVTTLAAVHLGLRRYDRRRVDGVALPFSAIAEVGRQLRLLSNDERAAHPCIGAGRADLVVAGCAILDAIHEIWPFDRLRVADRGLREGILGEFVGHSLAQALLPPGRAA